MGNQILDMIFEEFLIRDFNMECDEVKGCVVILAFIEFPERSSSETELSAGRDS